MPLDPQCESFLAPLNAVEMPPLDQLDPPTLRQMFRAMTGGQEGEPVARVENLAVPGPAGDVPVRLYRSSLDAGLPTLVYFHGGGFVVCDLDSHDASCRGLANAAGCAVLSVDYRLAPEAKFPAAPEDCYAATRFVAESGESWGLDPERIAIGDDSAGGNLTASVALLARERGGPKLAHQLLIYPVTDHAFDTPSYEENAEGYLLSRDMMRWFWRHYLESEADGANPIASPLRAADLSGLPPASVITAEFDPLRDEGEAYAERLRGAGVATDAVRFDGMIHGFFGMTDIVDRARDAVALAAGNLRAAFDQGA